MKRGTYTIDTVAMNIKVATHKVMVDCPYSGKRIVVAYASENDAKEIAAACSRDCHPTVEVNTTNSEEV
jgi:hypothetical protein